MSRHNQRGAALLLTLAVLGVLALMATVFVRTMKMEREASRAHADRVRARMLAEAGIERAIGHLRAESRAGDVSGDDWRCGDAPGTPLHALKHPSLRGGVAHGYAFSGTLGGDIESPDPHRRRALQGSYAVDGDQYALRIEDLGARLDLGDRDPSGEGALRAARNLARALSVSPDALASLADITPIRHPGDLWRRLGSAAEPLRPYLTVSGARDQGLVDPGERSKLTRPGLKRASAPRAPLNVNAAPRLLLQAAFSGLAAVYPDPDRGITRRVSIDAERAAALTELVIAGRPYASLEALESRLAGLVGRGLTAEEATLLMVNADPLPRLLKLNPDAALFGPIPRRFDRSDLTQWTVELTCQSSGRFMIESHGRVLTPGGSVAASSEIETVVVLAEHKRIRSQADWIARRMEGGGEPLRSYPVANEDEASELAGRLALDRQPLPGRSWFAPNSFEATGGGSPSVGDARGGSAMVGSDRYADGFHAPNDAERRLAYPASEIGLEQGSVSFWWKRDWQRKATGGLLYLDQPMGKGRGVSTILYIHRGLLLASRTFYRWRGGKPTKIVGQATKEPYSVIGEIKPGAVKALEQRGTSWLARQKPGRPTSWYRAYGRLYRDRVMRAIAAGKRRATIYITEFEAMFKLGHMGCVTHAIHIPDTYGLVFQDGWKETKQEAVTSSYIDVVDESERMQFRGGEMPFAASRVERGMEIWEGLPKHEWVHIQVSWTDGTNVRLYVNGRERRDHERFYSPMTPWSSRLIEPSPYLQPGPLKLDRASGHGGRHSPKLTGEALYLGNHGTLEGLTIGEGPTAPAPRYAYEGALRGRLEPPANGQLVRARLIRTEPRHTRVRLRIRGEGGWTSVPLDARSGDLPRDADAFKITLRSKDRMRARSPFVEGLELTYAIPVRELYRYER